MIDLQIGDLILVKGDNFINDAIEVITNSPYSHVAGVINTNGTIIEAQGFTPTRTCSVEKYIGKADVYRLKRKLTDEEKNAIRNYAIKKLGTQYDYYLVFLELLRYSLHIVIPYFEKKKFICSTLWTDAYKQAGITLCENTNIPSPADLSMSPLLEVVGTF